jgi:hypothetical protein
MHQSVVVLIEWMHQSVVVLIEWMLHFVLLVVEWMNHVVLLVVLFLLKIPEMLNLVYWFLVLKWCVKLHFEMMNLGMMNLEMIQHVLSLGMIQNLLFLDVLVY